MVRRRLFYRQCGNHTSISCSTVTYICVSRIINWYIVLEECTRNRTADIDRSTVVIDYGDGYTGVYTGLSSIAVGSGGSVKTGATIGTSGSLPSGEQGLYFEIRYRLAAMNPAAWLR